MAEGLEHVAGRRASFHTMPLMDLSSWGICRVKRSRSSTSGSIFTPISSNDFRNALCSASRSKGDSPEPKANDAPLGVQGGFFVNPEDREVARRIEVELHEVFAKPHGEEFLIEPGVRPQRDQLILEWHG